MRLKLTRPLVFPDLETTGKDVNTAEIVEICMIKVFPDGTTDKYYTLVKPINPIPPDATAVHHITDEDVANAPLIREIADEIYHFCDGCDIAGYNSNRYDIPIMTRVLDEAGFDFPKPDQHLVDACNIFKREEGRTLKDAHKFYVGEELEDAHAATVDVEATIKVLLAQVEMYPHLPDTVEGLALYSNFDEARMIGELDKDGKFGYDEYGYPIFKFGKKFINQRCTQSLDTLNYLDWMIKADSFSANTKRFAQEIKDGKYEPNPKITAADQELPL